ncbi:hypothetical protein DsansV1_C07g0068371 [Dioscorea sansibarensis]
MIIEQPQNIKIQRLLHINSNSLCRNSVHTTAAGLFTTDPKPRSIISLANIYMKTFYQKKLTHARAHPHTHIVSL